MPDITEWKKLNDQMPDGGPIYTETNPLETIMEPWNAVSSLAFLLPALYWIWVCRNCLKENSFLLCCCLLLALGGLGSTFYHAFRKFPLLLLMDIVPIIVLILLVSAYFWLKLLKTKWPLIPIFAFAFGLRYWAMMALSPHDGINVGYFISGVLIFLPVLILMLRTRFLYLQDMILSVTLLGLALFFRKADAWYPPLLSMGTHWLWHVLCAAGAFYLGKYIYHLENTDTRS